MKWVGVFVALMLAGAAYGIGPWGIGVYHILGIPMGESTITETDYTFQGQTYTATVDMTDGYPFKMSAVNFGLGGIVYFTGMFAAEVGFEMHTGYKNKEARIRATYTFDGMTDHFGWLEEEDNVTWKMMNIYVGPRYAYKLRPDFWILGRGGLLYSLRSEIEYDKKWRTLDIIGVSEKGTHLGVYGGGGFNWFFMPHKFAVTGLYTYNKLFEGTYTYAGLPVNFDEKWKPASYVTVGTGVEYYF